MASESGPTDFEKLQLESNLKLARAILNEIEKRKPVTSALPKITARNNTTKTQEKKTIEEINTVLAKLNDTTSVIIGKSKAKELLNNIKNGYPHFFIKIGLYLGLNNDKYANLIDPYSVITIYQEKEGKVEEWKSDWFTIPSGQNDFNLQDSSKGKTNLKKKTYNFTRTGGDGDYLFIPVYRNVENSPTTLAFVKTYKYLVDEALDSQTVDVYYESHFDHSLTIHAKQEGGQYVVFPDITSDEMNANPQEDNIRNNVTFDSDQNSSDQNVITLDDFNKMKDDNKGELAKAKARGTLAVALETGNDLVSQLNKAKESLGEEEVIKRIAAASPTVLGQLTASGSFNALPPNIQNVALLANLLKTDKPTNEILQQINNLIGQLGDDDAKEILKIAPPGVIEKIKAAIASDSTGQDYANLLALIKAEQERLAQEALKRVQAAMIGLQNLDQNPNSTEEVKSELDNFIQAISKLDDHDAINILSTAASDLLEALRKDLKTNSIEGSKFEDLIKRAEANKSQLGNIINAKLSGITLDANSNEAAKLKAEEEAAKVKAEVEARSAADEAAKLKAEEARLAAVDEAAKLKAEEAAKLAADEAAKVKAEEEARLAADETVVAVAAEVKRQAALAEVARKDEQANKAEEAHTVEEARKAEEDRKVEEARKDEEKRKAEEDAEKISEAKAAFEKLKNDNGEDHPDTLNSMGNLALLHHNQGNLNEAERLYRDALDKMKKKLGPQHPDTLALMNNLAILLQAQGNLNEAEKLFRKVLEGRKTKLGRNHPDTLSSMNRLAVLLQDQNIKLDEAEKLYRDALKRRIKELGPEDPDTLALMNNLASLLQAQGKLSEAKTLLNSVLERRNKLLGPNHEKTKRSKEKLEKLEALITLLEQSVIETNSKKEGEEKGRKKEENHLKTANLALTKMKYNWIKKNNKTNKNLYETYQSALKKLTSEQQSKLKNRCESIKTLINKDELKIIDYLTSPKIVSMILFKLIVYALVAAATAAAVKSFTKLYTQRVYTQNLAPPPLTQMLGIFLAFCLTFVGILLVLLWAAGQVATGPIFRGADSYIELVGEYYINDYLFSFVLDFLIFITALSLVTLVFVLFLEDRRFFRYQTEGLRAVRVTRDILLSVGAFLIVWPYFLIY